jgi:hypothetical protein
MPVLAREPDVYPPELLERDELGRDEGVIWWALYTLSRHEKELMRRLRGLDIPFYAPLVARRSRSPEGRLRISYVPLFANYVFLYGNDNDRHRAMKSNCISRWLPVSDGAQLTQDLRQISRLIDSDAPLTPEARLEPGMRVRVRTGPLLGLEGVIIRRSNQARLLISVNFLKQGASLLLDDCHLEQVN